MRKVWQMHRMGHRNTRNAENGEQECWETLRMLQEGSDGQQERWECPDWATGERGLLRMGDKGPESLE